MKSRNIELTGTDKYADACPWCDCKCQYIETDTAVNPVQYRVGCSCSESYEAEQDHGDAMGNDWGRSNWHSTIIDAVFEWNEIKSAGESTGQRGVW